MADTPLSVLVIARAGAAVTGVESAPVLSAGSVSGPLAPSSATDTVLAMAVTPAASGESIVTANVAEPDAPAARSPTANVQALPVQAQPGVEAPASNVVLAGTVSLSTTP